MVVDYAAAHEEVERLERLIVRELKRETRSHKDKLSQNHRVRKMMDSIGERSKKIVRPPPLSAPLSSTLGFRAATLDGALVARVALLRRESTRTTTAHDGKRSRPWRETMCSRALPPASQPSSPLPASIIYPEKLRRRRSICITVAQILSNLHSCTNLHSVS
jgi:hypothetical protein